VDEDHRTETTPRGGSIRLKSVHLWGIAVDSFVRRAGRPIVASLCALGISANPYLWQLQATMTSEAGYDTLAGLAGRLHRRLGNLAITGGSWAPVSGNGRYNPR